MAGMITGPTAVDPHMRPVPNGRCDRRDMTIGLSGQSDDN
jgi:hypothetical protein